MVAVVTKRIPSCLLRERIGGQEEAATVWCYKNKERNIVAIKYSSPMNMTILQDRSYCNFFFLGERVGYAWLGGEKCFVQWVCAELFIVHF